jgi:hypothetical protein
MLMSYYAHGLISPAVHTVLMSFFEVYTAIKDMKELGEVVSSYVEYVEHSAFLSVEDKYALLTALAVADTSPRFWLPIMLILPE